jgi:hypothetical protein
MLRRSAHHLEHHQGEIVELLGFAHVIEGQLL